MELGDPHTAQEVLLKQVRQIVASKAPLGFTDKTLPLIQPAKSFQNANILEEMRPREREVVQEKRPPLVAMRNDSIPSPKPLGPENRMGSDDLLSDENIEKMEKSYSDDEGKKLESDFTGLESQEEMENLSQGRNSTHDDEDDDDHDSFASFLEHETSESMKGEKMLPPSVISSSRNTPISIPTPEKASVPLGKIKHIFDVNSHARLTQLAPREAVERVKTGTKRAPLDLTDANFPKKSKYSRAAPLVPRLQPPKGMNQALHMMRLILQPSFNKELFALVSDYLEIFYQAAGNITNNGSHDRIDEGKVQELVTGMLSEACRALHGEHQEPKLPKMYLVSDTDGHTPMSRQKLIRDKESRPPPQRQSRKPAGERSTSGRQIPDTSNWNPDQITESSKFVLGVRANEAYGYSGYRGKIYYVHPNLFRYNTDNEDRKYLLEHRKLTLQGGRAFLVLYDQIVQIMQTNTYYSDNETVVQEVKMLEDQAFTLPRFILRKVIDLMKDQICKFIQLKSFCGNSTLSL
jgi:deoxynucleotidyltransferase terminal-interacting protein 1